jgi:hypothetical protein
MPAKSLLNYIATHPIAVPVNNSIFIWNIIDQTIYHRYQVAAFPQLTIIKGQQSLYSFIGYNRELANKAIEILCKEQGLGRLVKQLNRKLLRCPNGHEMSPL